VDGLQLALLVGQVHQGLGVALTDGVLGRLCVAGLVGCGCVARARSSSIRCLMAACTTAVE
jgi:hypothetical protein